MYRMKEDRLVRQLQDMGFTEQDARAAVRRNGTFEGALDYLVNNPPDSPKQERKPLISVPKFMKRGNHEWVEKLHVGDQVEMKRSVGSWTLAEVLEVEDEAILVKYKVNGDVFNKRLAKDSPNLGRMGTNIREFALWENIELKHKGKWIEATITEIVGETLHLQFGYNGKGYRAELKKSSANIAKLGTHIEQPDAISPPANDDDALPPPPPDEIDPAPVSPVSPEPEIKRDDSPVQAQLQPPQLQRLQTLWDYVEIHGQPGKGDMLDCMDSSGKWYPVEVLRVASGRLLVHFMNFDPKWDTWMSIQKDYDKLAPFKTNSDMPESDLYRVGSSVRVLGIFPRGFSGFDTRWVPGEVLKVDGAQVMVLYEDPYMRRRKRWYHTLSDQVQPFGASKPKPSRKPNETGFEVSDILEYRDDYGQWHWMEVVTCDGTRMKLLGDFIGYVWVDVIREPERIRQLTKADEEIRLHEEEQEFIVEVQSLGLEVEDIERDGNCLFRSIAFLVYGDKSRHNEVRQACYDYILENRDYFQLFFGEDMDLYIREYAQEGKWGGEHELYALSELFNKRIEVYQQGMKEQPTFVMNGEFATLPILRLSYHGKSHYNAVFDPKSPESVGDGQGDDISIRETRLANHARELEQAQQAQDDDEKEYEIVD